MAADYDIIAIGGGAAGLVTAAGAAGLGARAALIERHRMGGECLWTGCVPSKALLACARTVAEARNAARYGVHVGDVTVDFAQVMRHVHGAQQAIAPNDSPARFRSLGVDVLEGEARFVADRTLRVGERTLTARHIVIATGSRPALPDIPGLADANYHTNETIFEIATLPASLIVLGGGAVGVELAHALALLGSRVTLIEAAQQILPAEDRELADLLKQELATDGVTVLLNESVLGVTDSQVLTQSGTYQADALLVATGREAVLDTLDLSAGGITTTDSGLRLDDRLRTTATNVWAAGDVTGAPRFTHVADYQARTVLRNALFPLSSKVNYDVVPRVTFTIPELASVGMTESQARNRFGEVETWRREYAHLDRAIADGYPVGVLKIVADAKGRILGAHALGQSAAGAIAEIALAMRANVKLAQISAIMHAYPTYSETVKQAADSFMRARFGGFAKRITHWLVRGG